MNKQQIFDKVASHLILQGERSGCNNISVYKDERGRRCAIGVFMRGAVQDSGQPINRVPREERAALIVSGVPLRDDTMELFMDLQFLHDKMDVRDWESALRSVAGFHKLDDTAVDEALSLAKQIEVSDRRRRFSVFSEELTEPATPRAKLLQKELGACHV